MAVDCHRTEELAHKILLHSRRRITHIAPILLESIYALPEKVCPFPASLHSDGRVLWFCPEQVVADFHKDRDSVARQLLHITSHCLLGHLELRGTFEQKRSFDCAADLKAAQFAEGLCGCAFAANRPNAFESFEHTAHLHPLYDALRKNQHEGHQLRQRATAARFDDHNLWSVERTQVGTGCAGSDGSEHENTGTETGGQNPCEDSGAPDWNRIRQSMLDGNGGKLPGNCAGMLTETFSVPERGMSFAAFLKRFASPEERMLPDPDAFDARWYHLGLEYYGDIPLLEPSELSEPPLPDDIVIALDTSGSCSGDTCKRFLKETLGILRDISAGASRFRVLLLQCDTHIQSEVLLESPEQAEALFRSFSAHGFGGTDFRPVFKRVEELRRDGTLPRIRGLLYLTDGWGSFPHHPSDYPAVFLIPEEEKDYWPGNADWITRLYLNQTDFTLKEVAAT